MMIGISAVCASLFRRRQDLPAVDARHDDVEDDRRRIDLPGQPQPFLAACGGAGLVALLVRFRRMRSADRDIVINDQYQVRRVDRPRRDRRPAAAAGGAAAPRTGASSAGRSAGSRKVKVEPWPTSLSTVDLAPHRAGSRAGRSTGRGRPRSAACRWWRGPARNG